ncbi:putative glycolipid-binding domain-containing protein [Mesorhizobium sp. NPDC059054]|uniref:putative glycolipid-binding domain-containing protein n=1 Tax=Mesorhizobium sp. NPDC059054 TaxID=3346711 RepID=UPI0036752043
MDRTIVARWQEWDGDGTQYLVLSGQRDGMSVDAVAISSDPYLFAARYRIAIDVDWLTRRLEVSLVGREDVLILEADGKGHWTMDGQPMPTLDGVLEPDLSVSPFTNTLPIKRLRLAKGESAEIRTAYISVPALEVFPDPQRYTCLEEGSRYLYESLDSDFRREITFDEHGLVTDYPGLFRRLF